MANRFVDFVNGSDANNGAGPDASHATNKPWKTVTKALGASGAASGDTIYLSPAGPFRETVSVAMTSPAAETKVIGDVNNEQGFKTSGAALVQPGPVILTAFTTNDKTAPSSTTLLNLNARDNLTFRHILFVGGTAANTITATTALSTDIKFEDCAFIPGLNHQILQANGTFGTPFNWTFDRCYFGQCDITSGLLFSCPRGTGSDYDINVQIRNCVFVGTGTARAIEMAPGGSGTAFPGGLDIVNCTGVALAGGFFFVTTASASSSIPCTVRNCHIQCAATALSAVTTGTIVEDYNIITAAAALSNVTLGTHTVADARYAPLWHFGQERIWGAPFPRRLGEPMASSPLLGFGNDGTETAYDITGRPRPAGGGATPAAGAFERGNTGTQDASPIDGGGSAGKLVGAAYAEFLQPIPPGGTYDVSVTVKWDATYAGTKPQLEVDANGRLGSAAETVTATGSSGSNETLTLSSITNSTARYEMVVIRVKSLDTNGAGVVQFDNFQGV